MRTIRKNKQQMYYATLKSVETEYKLDKDGNKIVVYTDPDGTEHYQETGKKTLVYNTPVEFFASISFSGSDSYNTPFGISDADYDATIVAENNAIPITETSVIWYDSQIVYKDTEQTIPDVESADYTIAKVTPGLNTTRYALAKVVK